MRRPAPRLPVTKPQRVWMRRRPHWRRRNGGDSQLQQAQFTFLDWVKLAVFGKQLTPLKPTTKEDAWLAEKKAIVRAAIVSEEMKMAERSGDKRHSC